MARPAPRKGARASELTPLRVVDLFAGCGGLTLGLMETGRFESVAAVEMDPHAAATYATNFGEHVHVGDIAEWLEGELPEADVIVGGPPCQGFSSLGSRRHDDVRNSLWERYVEAVVRIQPRYFVIENVPQFLKSPQMLQLRAELEPGGRLGGYVLDPEPAVLNSADFGAAQNRRRAIIIGRQVGQSSLGPLRRRDAKTVKDAIRNLEKDPKGTTLPSGRWTDTDHEIPGPFSSDELHITRNFTELSLKRFSQIKEGGNRFSISDDLLPPCWRNHQSGSADVMGRLHWDKPSVTIRTEFFKPEKGRYLHPEADRSITHLEAARLQGFPEGFKWCGTKVSIARQIGNAVPMQLARAIGEAIAAAADGTSIGDTTEEAEVA